MMLMLRVDELLSGIKHDAVNESTSIRKTKTKYLSRYLKKTIFLYINRPIIHIFI